MALTMAGLLHDLADRGLELPDGIHLLGVGWATVDLDRAADDLRSIVGEAEAAGVAGEGRGPLDHPGAGFRRAPDDEALGARARRSQIGGVAIVLLEPKTEGRLAASLARLGEGPIAAWVAEASVGPEANGHSRLAGPLQPPMRDALGGLSRLARPPYPWGPFLLYHQPMTAGPTLRPAAEADAEAIATLFTDEGYPAGPSDIRERMSRFDSDYSTVRVAELGGDVVGFVAVHVMPRFEHGDRIARILALIVDAGVRERGIGHLLMSAAEDVARETDCAFIEITAGRHRPDAQRLYESVGYEAGIATYLRKRL